MVRLNIRIGTKNPIFRYYDSLRFSVYAGLICFLGSFGTSSADSPETNLERIGLLTESIIENNLDVLQIQDVDSCLILSGTEPTSRSVLLIQNHLIRALSRNNLKVYIRDVRKPELTNIAWYPEHVSLRYEGLSSNKKKNQIVRIIECQIACMINKPPGGEVVWNGSLSGQVQDTLKITDLDYVERGAEFLFGHPERPSEKRLFSLLETIAMICTVALSGYLFYIIRS